MPLDENNAYDFTEKVFCRFVAAMSLRFDKLPAEGVDVSAEGLLDVLLGGLVLVDECQKAVSEVDVR